MKWKGASTLSEAPKFGGNLPMVPKATPDIVAERQRLKVTLVSLVVQSSKLTARRMNSQDAAFYLCLKAQMCKGTNDMVNISSFPLPTLNGEKHVKCWLRINY